MKEIKYIKGDVTEPVGEGTKMIVHICNDVGAWGAGFVMALSKKWEDPEKFYRKWFESKDDFELGRVRYVQVESDIIVVNMIAQKNIMSELEKGNVPIQYGSVEECLNRVCRIARHHNYSVHMPRIGCGLAGGEWSKIEPIIQRALIDKNVSVTVYDFE